MCHIRVCCIVKSDMVPISVHLKLMKKVYLSLIYIFLYQCGGKLSSSSIFTNNSNYTPPVSLGPTSNDEGECAIIEEINNG